MTDKQTEVSELLKPRYKVIADYPGCPFIDGYIYTPEEIMSEDYSIKEADDIDRFPNIFKKVDWVEGREGRDWFPEYISRMYEGKKLFYKLTECNVGKLYKMLPDLEIGLLSYLGTCFPATKEEYESFINQNKQS